jgi:hypothetical protein
MSCQRAAELLGRGMSQALDAIGERWSGDLAVKINGLNGMYYWDRHDEARFSPDYAFLHTALQQRRQGH